MAKGGKQPGAGRPKGAITKSTADALEMRKKIVESVNQKLQPLLEAKYDLAFGHKKGVIDKETGEIIKVYTESPDGNAIQYLLNQAVGKPKETVEMQGDVILKVDY